MQLVKLKNGSEELDGLVNATYTALGLLYEKNPAVVYELVMKCRDRNHKLFGQSGQDLVDLNLLQPDQQPHQSVRNIVLSAVKGDGLDMQLVWPVAKAEAEQPK